jgi:hypothetical protein
LLPRRHVHHNLKEETVGDVLVEEEGGKYEGKLQHRGRTEEENSAGKKCGLKLGIKIRPTSCGS